MKKIRLGIDARILSQAMNGVARYAIAILKDLPKHEQFEVYLFSDSPLREEYREYFSNYHLVLFNNRRFKKCWKNWILPFQLLKYRIDLYHAIWDKGLPLVSPCPAIMSIHDLYSISEMNRTASPKKKFYRFINLFLEGLAAKKIFTVSESTKKEIIEKLHVPPEKITVTYPDCDKEHIEKMAREGPAIKLPANLQPKEYIVSVAGRLDDVRKNVPFIIMSFSKFLKEAKCRDKCRKLVIVGSYDENSRPFGDLKSLIDEDDLQENVIFTGYLPDPVLYNLVGGARFMVFASLFEGFGIPLLEAFFLGVPVITSNVSSMAEIASSANALLIDPTSEKELAAAMASLWDNPALRTDLAENGRKRLHDFDWDSAMKKIIAAYGEVLKIT